MCLSCKKSEELSQTSGSSSVHLYGYLVRPMLIHVHHTIVPKQQCAN